MKKMKMAALAASALIMSTVPATMAQAATLTIDVTGWNAEGFLDAAGNTLQNFNIGAGSTVTGVAYDVTIEAFDPSWLSEATFSLTDSDQFAGVFISPGFEDDNPGVGSYSDSVTLADFGLDFAVGSDGILRVEFIDTFVDAVSPNATALAGTLTITYDAIGGPAVPEPAAWALMIGGFGAVGGAMRRRGKQTVSVTYA
ncbi:PEPxxWA-CTERM sorting domain-containing protein [Sphingomonas sp. 1P06PA]|uniref:PEPxxWA-CTERM sorting domain-containing protein n=1 Tax=Sphingomonas sp. 1P06PA TaxID=554121 RepID=UPI0039A4A076